MSPNKIFCNFVPKHIKYTHGQQETIHLHQHRHSPTYGRNQRIHVHTNAHTNYACAQFLQKLKSVLTQGLSIKMNFNMQTNMVTMPMPDLTFKF